MPRMNVYVSDELKARMDKAKGANWSATAQSAFEKEINRMESSMTASTIEDAVTRLRASKQLAMDTDAEQGKDCGTRWALKRASYGELKRVADLKLDQMFADPLSLVVGKTIDAVFPSHEFWENETDDAEPDDVFVHAFVEAAAEVFDKVEARI